MRTQLLVVVMCASCDLDSSLPTTNDDGAPIDATDVADAPDAPDARDVADAPDAADVDAPVVFETWIPTESLTPGRFAHAAVARNGRLYVFGGQVSDTATTDVVQMASVMPDGNLTSWSETTRLPAARGGHASVGTDGHVYVLGGCCTGGQQVADVFYAPILADGTLGTWASTTPLPSARQTFAAVAHNGRVYAVAGNFGAGGINRQDVQMSNINGDGSLGPWTALTPLPAPWTAHTTIATTVAGNSHLYLIGGGRSGEQPNGDVLVAPINGDGTIGAWASSTALPMPRAGHTSVVLNGTMRVMGGAAMNGGNGVTDVNEAPIAGAGGTGPWTAKAPLPIGRTGAASVVANGRVYVIGGLQDNTTPLGDVHALTPLP